MIRFISDLHLSSADPATAQAFLRFLAGPARDSEALWILGDLFEYWAGDDDLDLSFNAEMAEAMRAVSDAGVSIGIIVGNRDFLLGPAFATRTGATLATDPHLIELGNTRTLLMHGDSLCTDDVPYMQFRQTVRNPAWQAQFLAQPVVVRRKIAEELRAKSEAAKQDKDIGIMDVNTEAVAHAFRDHNADLIIHGHTHRPARHEVIVDGRACVRWVLADWHGQAHWLQWDGHALSAHQGE
jgi:UDP-2,3-diacylglucosamine hydrolase